MKNSTDIVYVCCECQQLLEMGGAIYHSLTNLNLGMKLDFSLVEYDVVLYPLEHLRCSPFGEI